MGVDLAQILKLLEDAIKIKDEISEQIKKETDAKKRKKLRRLCREHNLIAVRAMLYDD